MEKREEITGVVRFEETRKFPGWFLLTLGVLTGSSLLTVVVVTLAVSSSSEEGIRGSITGLAIAIPLQVISFLIFYWLKLEKAVAADGLYYRWLPYQKKYRVIPFEGMTSGSIRKTPSLKLGAARLPGYGKVHSTGEKEGVQLEMKDGRQFFFSSDNPQLLLEEINRSINRFNQRYAGI